MQRDEVRKLQEIELNLLIEADRICKELNINYYIIGGTLLGAVRHGGFIPWDVDIDIAMVRKDYEIFREYCIKKHDSTFFYEDYTTEKNHSECHAILKLKGTEIIYASRKNDYYKLQNNGIYMDIFPLDFAPNGLIKQEIQQKVIKFFSSLLQAKICRDYGTGKTKYWIKKILCVLLKPVSFNSIQKVVDRVMQKYNDDTCEYIVSMASHYSYKKQLMPFEIYGKPIKINFEGYEFYAPAKVDEYLNKIYGNYMSLPPENKRYGMVDSIEYVNYGAY